MIQTTSTIQFDSKTFWVVLSSTFSKMGSLIGLDKGLVDVVEHVLPFVDEDEGLAISEAVMTQKPMPNPIAKSFVYWNRARNRCA